MTPGTLSPSSLTLMPPQAPKPAAPGSAPRLQVVGPVAMGHLHGDGGGWHSGTPGISRPGGLRARTELSIYHRCSPAWDSALPLARLSRVARTLRCPTPYLGTTGDSTAPFWA
ncbi:hypothetical protein KIL84_001623 [Mauremys mutica]|uniref:Uncharacterized protein n=1 Tax=Mauremys mutica TaxID=74926 RepID=A0A9D4B516_9SAUR|nr:hypothetical protein KIL84_001623 [Mauremys mutica]